MSGRDSKEAPSERARAKGVPDSPAPPDSSWGYPRFAKDFPRDPALDALVDAFARGDYATVRAGAPKLAESTSDDAVKRAAQKLRERIEPDPASKVLFLIAATLLVFLAAFWVTHDGPELPTPPRPKHVD